MLMTFWGPHGIDPFLYITVTLLCFRQSMWTLEEANKYQRRVGYWTLNQSIVYLVVARKDRVKTPRNCIPYLL